MDGSVAALVIGGLGLAVGSFLNVCIHRLPLGESVVRPASRCPSCGQPIRWYDNIPVVSWIVLRGRCRDCGGRISARYPFIEVSTGLLFWLHAIVYGLDPLLVPRLIFAAALIALFFIDLEHRILPNVITLPGVVLGLAFSIWLPPGLTSALIGVLVGGGVLLAIGELYLRVRGEEGMGMGDVKMLAMIGAFLGWQLTILTLVLASFAGSLVGIALIASRKGGMKYALPFGTFLSVGALVAGLFGTPIVDWYMGFYQ